MPFFLYNKAYFFAVLLKVSRTGKNQNKAAIFSDNTIFCQLGGEVFLYVFVMKWEFCFLLNYFSNCILSCGEDDYKKSISFGVVGIKINTKFYRRRFSLRRLCHTCKIKPLLFILHSWIRFRKGLSKIKNCIKLSHKLNGLRHITKQTNMLQM